MDKKPIAYSKLSPGSHIIFFCDLDRQEKILKTFLYVSFALLLNSINRGNIISAYYFTKTENQTPLLTYATLDHFSHFNDKVLHIE